MTSIFNRYKRISTSLTRLCLLSLTLLLSNQLLAATSNYKVEVLVFSYLGSDTLNNETWPEITGIPEVPNARSLGYRENGSGYFTRLGSGAISMGRRQNALRNDPNYRVLFHEAWIQPVGSTEGKHTIRITGGSILDNGLYELDGYISVDKGRYLHFRNNLFLNRELSPAESQRIIRNSDIASGEIPATAETSPALPDFSGLPETTIINEQPVNDIVADFLTVQMESGRRMKRNEIHYIDHPLMGILVYITAYDPDNGA